MLKAIPDKNQQTTLSWTLAKIVPMQFPKSNTNLQSDNNDMPEESRKENKEKNCTVKFCEPVFRPKKHEFL